jgi:protein involved in polysaccharide export with SLBB domain
MAVVYKMRRFVAVVRLGTLAGLAALALTADIHAQTPANAERQQVGREISPTTRRPSDLSDLGKENLNHLAASATQLRTVLLKDEGLLVELKRYVIKEATDNGQLAEDSSLTDQAIFDRLDRDIAFRSVATRLVQRYGYLLPSFNPDSEIGKQRELLLKERARRQVQEEEQEDADAAANLKRTAGFSNGECDERAQEDCTDINPQRTQRGTTSRVPRSGQPLDQSTPSSPQVPSPSASSSQILRASDGLTDFGSSGSQGSSSDSQQLSNGQGSLGYQGQELSDDGSSSEERASRANQMMAAAQGLRTGGLDLDSRSLSRPDLGGATGDSSAYVARNRESSDIDSRNNLRRSRWFDEVRRRSMTTDLSPVSMVHRPNPYSEIPSLYDMYVQASTRQRPLERFGLDVFRSDNLDPDEFPMDLPAGADYVVGPGDGLSIDLWGGVSQRLTRVVDRQGRISLPESGPVLVSGHSLGEVQQTVQQVLRANFRDVSADVSLSRLRTVRVYVVGDVTAPGAYDISSLSTPLNALFKAGGVTPSGSLRNIKHFRGKQLVEDVDAYDLLLHGLRGQMEHLENGDTLLVAPVGPQVAIDGMVRRPAIYELRDEKSLEDVVELAGGILPAASLQHIEVQRLDAHENHTMLSLDLPANSDPDSVAKQLGAFKIQDGDQVHIFPIAPYNESAIFLQGHVLRPGRYSYSDGMKLTDLIKSYNDLLPEPAGHYAEIVRLNLPDYRPTVESFDLAAALANPASAPKLEPQDTVRIFGRFDFESAPDVWIGGDVRAPGKYGTSGQIRLRDAVFLAGGVSPDAALDSAQLFRTESDGKMKIMSVNLRDALAGNPTDNILLEPRDRLLVHRNITQVDPAVVDVKGEVAKPGRYPLTSNMHVEDLIQVAGGLKRSADSVTADLTRYAASDPQKSSTESSEVQLSAALSGAPDENKLLRDGDVLTIRQNPGWNDIGASVTIRGEVQHPGPFGIRAGERLSSVLERAGGFSPEAYPYGAVLMRREVREMEMSARLEMVRRVKDEQTYIKSLPDTDQDQKNAKLTAIAETETTLTQLQANPPVGRVVIHIRSDLKEWRNTSADVPVSDGDVLVIPKKADYVSINGQVFNPTAVSYRPGRSARWYLSQAGGFTGLANKKAVFVIRGDGSVLAAKNNSGEFWTGDPLGATLRPGDTIVVPELAPRIGGHNWQNLFQAGQLAASAALAVAYIHP